MFGGFVYGQGRKSDVYYVDLSIWVSGIVPADYHNMVYVHASITGYKIRFWPISFYQFESVSLIFF